MVAELEAIPVVIVDDDAELTSSMLGALTDEFPAREITVYNSYGSALSLLSDARPFVMILDHNLGEDTEKGFHLAALVRKLHAWGAVVPICYFSGNQQMNEDVWLKQESDAGPLAPTFYVSKHSGMSAIELVSRMDAHFDSVRDFWVNQAEEVMQLFAHGTAKRERFVVLGKHSDDSEHDVFASPSGQSIAGMRSAQQIASIVEQSGEYSGVDIVAIKALPYAER